MASYPNFRAGRGCGRLSALRGDMHLRLLNEYINIPITLVIYYDCPTKLLPPHSGHPTTTRTFHGIGHLSHHLDGTVPASR